MTIEVGKKDEKRNGRPLAQPSVSNGFVSVL